MAEMLATTPGAASRWKGASASYCTIHQWARRHVPTVGKCLLCGSTERPTELANKDHEYRRDPEDWMEVCRPCHRRYDLAHGFARKTGCKRCGTPVDDMNPDCRTCRRRHYRRRKDGTLDCLDTLLQEDEPDDE